MKTIYTADHHLHAPKAELSFGKFVPPQENPRRADTILAELEQRKLGAILPPETFDMAPIRRVHEAGLVDFLAGAHQEWSARFAKSGGEVPDALPLSWPVPGMRRIEPRSIFGKLALHAIDSATAITATSWSAARAAADVAMTAQRLVAEGERAAFALCRPPGHHASAANYGGYCFLNNAGIAAEAFRAAGAARVAILDVDYHHGNGTQALFYARPDIFFVSLHAEPETDYPYFSGYADEAGEGPGEGFNANYPMKRGTDWRSYGPALAHALGRIRIFAPEAVVVSLGVDTFERDPMGRFKLASEDYRRMGETIAGLGLPVLFVMEGGYAVEELGVNVANVLEGFEQAAR